MDLFNENGDLLWSGSPEQLNEILHVDTDIAAAYFLYRKSALKSKINARRDQIISSGIDFNGHRFDSNETSKQRILGTLALTTGAPDEAPVKIGEVEGWITQDNQLVPMTLGEMRQLAVAVATNESHWVFWARSLKDQLAALADGDEAGLSAIEQALTES